MSRSAVIIGRTVSDLVRNLLTFGVMLVAAFLLGFRFGGSVTDAVLATGFSCCFRMR